jgi:protein TonB
LASALVHGLILGGASLLGTRGMVVTPVTPPHLTLQDATVVVPQVEIESEPEPSIVEVEPTTEVALTEVERAELPIPVPPEAFAAPPPPPPEWSATPRELDADSLLVRVLVRKPPAEHARTPLPPEPPAELPTTTPVAAVLETLPGCAPPPEYPRLARRRGWQGTVLVEVEVTTDGHVSQCHIKQSSGRQVLDEAALSAVRGWRFRNGPGVTEVPFEFVLRELPRN